MPFQVSDRPLTSMPMCLVQNVKGQRNVMHLPHISCAPSLVRRSMERSGTSVYEFWDTPYVTPTFLGSADTPTLDCARDANVAMPPNVHLAPSGIRHESDTTLARF